VQRSLVQRRDLALQALSDDGRPSTALKGALQGTPGGAARRADVAMAEGMKAQAALDPALPLACPAAASSAVLSGWRGACGRHGACGVAGARCCGVAGVQHCGWLRLTTGCNGPGGSRGRGGGGGGAGTTKQLCLALALVAH
jgi:hypothetical protein